MRSLSKAIGVLIDGSIQRLFTYNIRWNSDKLTFLVTKSTINRKPRLEEIFPIWSDAWSVQHPLGQLSTPAKVPEIVPSLLVGVKAPSGVAYYTGNGVIYFL